MAAGTIEIAPLAFMRGRSLNDSFIILDEAQNTSREQMKMFLTRLGFGSKMVVTGDVTQVDLPDAQISGLRVVQEILDGVPGHSLLPADQPGRGAAQARREDRRCLRPVRREVPGPLKTGNTTVSVEINNESGMAADEDALSRARAVRDRPDGDAPAGRPVHAAGGRGAHDQPAREVDGRARPDRRPLVPDGRAAPALDGGPEPVQGTRRGTRREPVLLGDVVLCPPGRGRPGPAARPSPPRPSSSC